MCHQSIGLIARQLEEAGIATVSLTSARTITAGANPPRAVFVDYPLGRTAGPPHDPATQRSILDAALDLIQTATVPGTILDLDLRWSADQAWKDDPMGARRSTNKGGTGLGGNGGGDNRTPRTPEPVYQSESDLEAAEARSWDEQCLVCVGIEPSA
ncbi:MAG: hypothetical protein GY745_05630 [Actinomycetia bacterium]|nr:hypothetical protein [Actinomycetes bacterium]MCP4084514.1 hypothetical protein [Actinomycetes bacterium]